MLDVVANVFHIPPEAAYGSATRTGDSSEDRGEDEYRETFMGCFHMFIFWFVWGDCLDAQLFEAVSAS